MPSYQRKHFRTCTLGVLFSDVFVYWNKISLFLSLARLETTLFLVAFYNEISDYFGTSDVHFSEVTEVYFQIKNAK